MALLPMYEQLGDSLYFCDCADAMLESEGGDLEHNSFLNSEWWWMIMLL